jgi:hypothetical protein
MTRDPKPGSREHMQQFLDKEGKGRKTTDPVTPKTHDKSGKVAPIDKRRNT